MDPKIAKKTQDSLSKFIKKPPLTEKLLSKPPFRFLHDVMTSVIKSTGVMKGLYTDSEMNSENVKDRDSKIAFLQKAVDYVSAASGKQLTVKPAKVVAGHEPEKTNEFLQALAQAISSKVDNDDVLNSMNNKDKPSKKEEKEEKTREKSSDRRKRDEDKRSRERGEEREKDRGKDREDRHKDRSRDREEKHKDRSRDREERHKDKEERHKDREHRDKDREREREGRHKSGRTRLENMGEEEDFENEAGEEGYHSTPDDIDSDVLLSDEEMDDGTLAGNATYAVLHPSQVFTDEESLSSPQSFKPIPRQVSRYQNMIKTPFVSKEDELELDSGDTDGQQNGSGHKIKRPKAARPRRKERMPTQGTSYGLPVEEPNTPFVSEDDSLADRAMDKGDQLENEGVTSKAVEPKKKRIKSHKKAKEENNNQTTHPSGKGKVKPGMYPKTSTPNSSPVSPKKNAQQAAYMSRVGKNKQVSPKNTESDQDKAAANVDKDKRSPMKSSPIHRKQKEIVVNLKKPGDRKGSVAEQNMKKMADAKKQSAKEKNSKHLLRRESFELDKSDIVAETKKERSRDVYSESRRRSREDTRMSSDDSPQDQGRHPKKSKDKVKYRNDDYAHEKIKNSKSQEPQQLERYESEPRLGKKENEEAYYKKKQPHGNRDRRKRSSFTSMLENKQQRREEEGKENDVPKETMVNGDHKANDAPQRIQRPSSAKGSRRRMEGGNLSSDEDVPAQRQEATLGEDDAPPQIAGRLARPSSARPAPPKRKEDTVQNEPAMRLGSGKPQNLILDDGKDSDEDETFVVEDAPAQLEEPEQPPAPMVEEDDEDHGGLVKKIMESKKEYEQPRETKIERPTISDAQRRKQREAVQREIDKLRGSIQTLTRSANPLGKIMDYVQEDLDSMQKELEKWKEENKEHALALKREKAITERAVEPLRVQLSEVDQAIKDQLDLIGAVKSNIIRNDQKIEKMLRTIAKS